MNLTPIKANMTELDLCDGRKILFSYRTPVAAKINGMEYRTSYKWSATTTRHINKWLVGVGTVVEKPQEYFDNLIAEVK